MTTRSRHSFSASLRPSFWLLAAAVAAPSTALATGHLAAICGQGLGANHAQAMARAITAIHATLPAPPPPAFWEGLEVVSGAAPGSLQVRACLPRGAAQAALRSAEASALQRAKRQLQALAELPSGASLARAERAGQALAAAQEGDDAERLLEWSEAEPAAPGSSRALMALAASLRQSACDRLRLRVQVEGGDAAAQAAQSGAIQRAVGAYRVATVRPHVADSGVPTDGWVEVLLAPGGAASRAATLTVALGEEHPPRVIHISAPGDLAQAVKRQLSAVLAERLGPVAGASSRP